MGLPEYEAYDALGLAELVRRNELSPTELLEAAIERIEARNPALNAVVRTMYDQAKSCIAAGLPDGPFRGVPFLLKDLGIDYSGVPTSNGSRLCKGLVPDRHSLLTERYLAAGLVIVGKTNTPEFGLSGSTEPEALGPCRNPWDVSRSPGGSSGGAAVAVAAAMAPMAHGSDAGGSIRNPASNCGLFGMKPTRARVPLDPLPFKGSGDLNAQHAVTRSVRDSAALLDATGKPAMGDAYFAPPPARPFLNEVGRDPGRLKIAFHTVAHHDVRIHPECVKAVERAAKLCEELGHIVEPAIPDIDGDLGKEASHILWPVDLAESVTAVRAALGKGADDPGDGSGLEWITRELEQKGKTVPALDYLRALRTMHRLGRRIAPFFERYDVVLSPVLSMPPWPLGAYEKSYGDTRSYVDTVMDHSPFCWPYNVSGQPAMSVPLHWTDEGLPVGVQFAGRYGDEATLFRLAARLEEARPWIRRRPTATYQSS